jgi:hypothetical protein
MDLWDGLANRKESKMLRILSFCSVALLGLSQLASAASISAVLMPAYTALGPALPGGDPSDVTGHIIRTADISTSNFYRGTISPYTTAPALQTVAFVNLDLDGGVALVRTDVSRQENVGATGRTRIALTTYANYYSGGGTSTGGAVISYVVNNKGFWEFTLDGNYTWSIEDTDPTTRGLPNKNFRTYNFVKVQGATETLLAANTTGTGSLSPSGGTTEIGSGVYRLYYHHYDSGIYPNTPAAPPDPAPLVNSVDLNIFFTLKSENGGGGGTGVVPEPASMAVFGLLGVGTVIAKWRRKKLQLAS